MLDRSIIELFEAQVRRQGSRLALDDGYERLSYAQTHQRVMRLAAQIFARTRRGDLVGVLLPASADFSIAMLACLATGRIVVPLDLHYPGPWIADVVARARMAAVIARFDGEAAALIPGDVIQIDVASLPDEPALPAFAPAGPDDPAVVIFTSGSSGAPKGIVNSQRNLLRRVEQYVKAARIGPDDGFAPLSSGCTIAGLRERLTALLSGAALYPIDVQRAGAHHILRRLEESQTTIIYAVPALLRTLMSLEAKAPAALRVVRVGGDAVLWSDVDLLRGWLPETCGVMLGYSSTEAPILQWFVPPDFLRTGSRVPIGYPLEDGELGIVNEDAVPVPPGVVGELVVRSPYVALGHWQAGSCDPTAFPQLAGSPPPRLLHTGDLVCVRKDGLIDLVGRKDRQVKIRGIRIEPGEIEATLRTQPGIADAAVFARRSGTAVSLIGYLVPRGDAPVNLAAAVKQALKSALPSHMQPQHLYYADRIPRLPSSKLDMAGLEMLDRAHQSAEVEPSPENPSRCMGAQAGVVEAVVTAIWRQLLNREHIDRDADFFDLGGDSLMTLKMTFALERELGVDLPVTMIFQVPTIAALSAAIESETTFGFSPLVKMKGGEGAPLFVVHGVGGNVMELFGFGRRLTYAGPVYAIQARGLDGRTEPGHSVAAMAEDYLKTIRAVYPHGPLHLAGYSSGGLIAFEMARQMTLAGEAVGSLTLLDTQTNARQWPFDVWVEVFARRLAHHLARMKALGLTDKVLYARGMASGLRRRIGWRLGLDRSARSLQTNAPVSPLLQKVYDAMLGAVALYRPGCYAGPMTLIVSEGGDPMMANPVRIWSRHAPRMTIRRVPGTHFSMVQGENARILAQVFSDVLAAHATA